MHGKQRGMQAVPPCRAEDRCGSGNRQISARGGISRSGISLRQTAACPRGKQLRNNCKAWKSMICKYLLFCLRFGTIELITEDCRQSRQAFQRRQMLCAPLCCAAASLRRGDNVSASGDSFYPADRKPLPCGAEDNVFAFGVPERKRNGAAV